MIKNAFIIFASVAVLAGAVFVYNGCAQEVSVAGAPAVEQGGEGRAATGAGQYGAPAENVFSVTVVYTADGLALPFKVKAKIGFNELLLTFVLKNDAVAAIETLKGAGIVAKMLVFGQKYEVSAPLDNILRVNVAGKPVYPMYYPLEREIPLW